MKGNFAASLADEGLTGDTDVKNSQKSIRFQWPCCGAAPVLQKQQPVSYTAKKDNSGVAVAAKVQ